MLIRIKPCIFILLMLCSTSFAEDQLVPKMTSASIILDRLKSIDTVEPMDWEIRNGCIDLHKIRAISFRDDQLAIIDLRRQRQAVLKLKRECRGIAQQGFTIETPSGQLCERFTQLTQAKSAISCEIESIEPHIRLSEVVSDTR